MKWRVGIFGVILVVIIGGVFGFNAYRDRGGAVVSTLGMGEEKILILDAGHGGEDGGAVSITGVPESQINLNIVLKMNDILGFYGTAPILLREEDISLHDESAVTLREKKVSDLKNRVEMIQTHQNATLISIHQNTYSDSKYHGAQVFFAETPGSKELGEQIQLTFKSCLQPENNRATKQIPESVFLMNHIDCPAVLVECGFLTNPEEEKQLRDSTYQKKLAALLSSVWLTTVNQTTE
jgi:N-acetylmuramoyl-L-alanine amidase